MFLINRFNLTPLPNSTQRVNPPVVDTTFGAKKSTKVTQTEQAATQPVNLEAIKLRKPPPLHPGDTIALVAPATPLPKKEVDEQAAYLRQQGYKVVRYESAKQFNRHYLSDTDARRAAALNRAFANPNVKAIFSVQGGGGTYRPEFLNQLDWATIRKNPKIVTGYSDITFLHHALLSQAGLVSFHSPFPRKSQKMKANTETFWAMVSPENPALAPKPIQAGKPYQCVVPGEVSGRLVGGNLSLVAATIGTKYEIDLTDKILFLEDWNDDFENTDRLFSQLSQHGVFQKIKGLIIGEFLKVPRKPCEYSLPWKKFILDVTKEAQKRGIPIGYDFPIGHGYNNRPLPHGIQAHFNSATGTLSFLESPLSAGK